MTSIVLPEFWDHYRRVPRDDRELARKNYRLWQSDVRHRSLHFKRVRIDPPFFSIRIGAHWRALALLQGDVVYWFWIGPHAEYDRLLGSL